MAQQTADQITRSIKALFVLEEQRPGHLFCNRFDRNLFRRIFMEVAHGHGLRYHRSALNPSAKQLSDRDEYVLYFRICEPRVRRWWNERYRERVKELMQAQVGAIRPRQLELPIAAATPPTPPPPWFQEWRANLRRFALGTS